jgi:hypothetical protein
MPEKRIEESNESFTVAQVGPERAPIVISLGEYKGNRFLDIRRYYKKRDSDALLPTRKGIGFNANVLEPVLDSVVDNKENIISWLNGAEDSVKQQTERDLHAQLDAKNAIAREARAFGVQDHEKKDQRFFSCTSAGAIDNISLNVSHPLNERIAECAGRIMEQNDKAAAEQILRDVIGAILVSYYRASSMFSGDTEMPAKALFDALEYEWGTILKNYTRHKY